MPESLTSPSQMIVEQDGRPVSQANTPFWQDKSLYVAVLGFILPIINRKFGLGLNAEEIVAALAPLAAFIIGNKWKSGRVLVEEIKASNAAAVQLPPGMSAAEASAVLSNLGK